MALSRRKENWDAPDVMLAKLLNFLDRFVRLYPGLAATIVKDLTVSENHVVSIMIEQEKIRYLTAKNELKSYVRATSS